MDSATTPSSVSRHLNLTMLLAHLLIALVLPPHLRASTSDFIWVRSMGGALSDNGSKIAVDSAGNVYTTGFFYGPADFDPGPGTYNLTSNGVGDIFISKLDSGGNFIWARSIGGTFFDGGRGIFVDNSGNVYTIGTFEGTVDFDPGAETFTLTSGAGENDCFISKLDSDGNFVWAKAMEGISADSTSGGGEVFVDISGNVYTSGTFWGTVDFDPGQGTYNLNSDGMRDIFVSKLDSSGNFVWAKSMGGTLNDYISSMFVDSFGNFYTTGFFSGTADFDPGMATYDLTSAGGSADIFVNKLDSSGNFVWAKSIGGTSSDAGNGIVVDTSGNIYTTGYFTFTVDFDPGPGTYILTGNSVLDIFISKMDSEGNLIWAKSMGGIGQDNGNDIVVDSVGNVYTTGSFEGTVDFDPGPGTFNLTSNGTIEIFISKLDSGGNLIWANSMGGTGTDYGNGIVVDSVGNVYTTGSFQETVDFDPGPGMNNLTSQGDFDIFVSKLDGQYSFPWPMFLPAITNNAQP